MTPLRVLMVEENEDEALSLALELRRAGYETEPRRVETAEELRVALREPWDVVVADWSLPRLAGLEALRLVRELRGADLPFVLVAGNVGEESAVAALKAGAGDLVTRANLGRLVPAIERELREAAVRRERRETLEGLSQAVAARDQFLSIASHELRTPLTSLQLQLQSLARMVAEGRGEPEGVARKLAGATRSADRMSELVNRLLEVSRIMAGRMEIVRERLDLSTLVAGVAERFRDASRDAGSTLEVVVPPSLHGRWDRLRVEAIVANLLSNAVQYGEGKPIVLRLESDGRAARLEVVDRGIGIAPADQARIFHRFERAVSEQHYGGFGFGLWVARLVAEAHGGEVEVASAPGEGSTFTVELPLDG